MASSPILRVGLKRSRPQPPQQHQDAFLVNAGDDDDDLCRENRISTSLFKRTANRNFLTRLQRPSANSNNNSNVSSSLTKVSPDLESSKGNHQRRSLRSTYSMITNSKSLETSPSAASSSSSSPFSSSRSLPVLLDQRQRGCWRLSSKWRERMLMRPEHQPQHQENKYHTNSQNSPTTNHWRDYAQRIIPFSHLQTPPCDAVLALERHGSYVLAVSEGDESYHYHHGRRTQTNTQQLCPQQPRLAIHFYGIPSPSVLETRRNQSRSRAEFDSILLHTTPLSWTVDQNSAPRNQLLDVMDSSSTSAALTPLRILISADGRMGAVFLRHAISSNQSSHSLGSALAMGQDDCLGTLTIFSLPRMNVAATGSLRTFQCANVRIAAWNAFTMRNLLWPVPIIPMMSSSTTSSPKIVSVRETPGYLLCNDEDDGFRLTWIADSDWGTTPKCGVHEVGESNLSVKPNRTDIVAVPERCAWETFPNTDDPTGEQLHSHDGRIQIDGGIKVVSEAFLSVEALLSDILERRNHLLPSRPSTDTRPMFPDFSYSLIAAGSCGRMVDLIITFESKKSAAVGVFLRVDLFTQAYEELDWIRTTSAAAATNTATNNNRASTNYLRRWSNTLALQRRARDMRVGPYGVSPDHDYFGHWGPLRGEVFYDPSAHDEDNPAKSQKQWHDYLDGLKWNAAPDTATLISATQVSYRLLYPDCEVITNAAVIKGTPVMRMSCQDSPIQIVYG